MIIRFVKENIFYIVIILFNMLVFFLLLSNNLKLKEINKNYKEFLKKIGNGENIEEKLKEYLKAVDNVKEENKEIIKFCNKIEEDSEKSIKKIELVRYNAFKDTGSNLSFALAMLNENNDGIILNGIYSLEASNIYAKEVKEGKTTANLSEEEKEALEKAIQK